MSVDERVRAGDFTGALDLLASELAKTAPDPGLVLMAFNLQVRVQRFEEAQQTISRVMHMAPQMGPAMDELARLALAEERAIRRLDDPELASRRAGLGHPPPHAVGYVQASIAHAAKDYAGAKAALAEVRAPATSGTATWKSGQTKPFEAIADSDDLTGTVLPCYSAETLLDIPYSDLASITFHDARTSFDVMWIPTELVPVAGEPLHVRVPAFYPGTGMAGDAFVRTGQMTTWNRDHGYAVALGQRDLKLGGAMTGILQLRRIELGTRGRAQA